MRWARLPTMPPHTVHLSLHSPRYTGSAPPSVYMVWPDAGGHAELEPVYLAALTGALRRFWACLPPPPPAQAVAPRPRAAGVAAFSVADGRPSERQPSAAAAPPPKQRATTPAGGRGAGGVPPLVGGPSRQAPRDRVVVMRSPNWVIAVFLSAKGKSWRRIIAFVAPLAAGPRVRS